MAMRMTWTERMNALAIGIALLGGQACASDSDRSAGQDDPTGQDRERVDQPPATDDPRQASAGAGSEHADDSKLDGPNNADGSDVADHTDIAEPTGPRKVAVLPDPEPGGQSGAEGSCEQACPDYVFPEPLTTEAALAFVLGSHEATLRFRDREWSHGAGSAAFVEHHVTLDVAARGDVMGPGPDYVNECGGAEPQYQLVDVAMRSDDGVLDVTFPGRATIYRSDVEEPAWLYIYFTDHSLFPAGFAPEQLVGSHHDDLPYSLSFALGPDELIGSLWVMPEDDTGVSYLCSVADIGDTSCRYGTQQPFDSAIGVFEPTELIDALSGLGPKPVQWPDGSETMLTIAAAEANDPNVCHQDIFSECTDLESLGAQLALHLVTDDGKLDVWLPVASSSAVSPTQGWNGDQQLLGSVLGPLPAFQKDGGKLEVEIADGKRVFIELRARFFAGQGIDSGELRISEVTPDSGAPYADSIVDTSAQALFCYGSETPLATLRWGDPGAL